MFSWVVIPPGKRESQECASAFPRLGGVTRLCLLGRERVLCDIFWWSSRGLLTFGFRGSERGSSSRVFVLVFENSVLGFIFPVFSRDFPL